MADNDFLSPNKGWALDSIHNLDERAGEWRNYAFLRMVHNSDSFTEGFRYLLAEKSLISSAYQKSPEYLLSYGRHYVFDWKTLQKSVRKVKIGDRTFSTPLLTEANMDDLMERRTEYERGIADGLTFRFEKANKETVGDMVRHTRRRDAQPGELARITVFNVGQGDLILLDITDGEQWLIDAWFWHKERYDNFKIYLDTQASDPQIDRLVISHLHYDHIKRATTVLDELGPREVLINDGLKHRTKTAEKLIAAADAAGRLGSVQGPQFICSGELELLIVPTTAYLPNRYSKDPNDHELVVLVLGRHSAALLAGDAPHEMLERIIEGDFPDADKSIGISPDRLGDFCARFRKREHRVYKVSHHCSHTGTSDKLISDFNPNEAATSCSATNRYGHPHDVPQKMISECCQHGGGFHKITCRCNGNPEYVIT